MLSRWLCCWLALCWSTVWIPIPRLCLQEQASKESVGGRGGTQLSSELHIHTDPRSPRTPTRCERSQPTLSQSSPTSPPQPPARQGAPLPWKAFLVLANGVHLLPWPRPHKAASTPTSCTPAIQTNHQGADAPEATGWVTSSGDFSKSTMGLAQSGGEPMAPESPTG